MTRIGEAYRDENEWLLVTGEKDACSELHAAVTERAQ
jgi:hypothetical protein